MNTATKYISGLKTACLERGGREAWEHLETIKQGATTEDLQALKKAYPLIPTELIQLLEYVDGTYWREYAGEKIAFYFLGSDIEEYPYYLLSSAEMVQNQDQAVDYYSDYIERKCEEVEMDEKITSTTEGLKWLHFSDCMNNGGTSQLFIDFSPSEKGKVGQVVRFVHDPDEFTIIADNFEAYLKNLMEEAYGFINEDSFE